VPFPSSALLPSGAQDPSPSGRIAVTFSYITTEDAAPAAAPYRISDKAGFNEADVGFIPQHDGTLVPGASLLPGDSDLIPPPPLRPGVGTFPGNHAFRRPGSQYPAMYPSDTMYPSRGAVIPSGGVNVPRLPTPAGTLPGAAVLPGRDIAAARDIVAYVLRENGSDSYTGRAVEFAGCRCGSLPCSPRRVASSQDYRLPSGSADALAVLYADANDGGGDGAKNMALWVTVENQGTG
jgi:hypothetical protein